MLKVRSCLIDGAAVACEYLNRAEGAFRRLRSLAQATPGGLMRLRNAEWSPVEGGKPARTTISDKATPCPSDHVNPRPNALWVSDFTYVATWAGFVYVAFVFATLEWVDWFNKRRLLEPIGNIPPAEAEERYYAMLEQPAMAA